MWAAFRFGMAIGLLGVGTMFLALAVTSDGYGGFVTYGGVCVFVWMVAAAALKREER